MVWDPYEEIRRFEERMNKLFEDFWRKGGRPLLAPGRTALEPYREPYTDLVEGDKEVIATIELPGFEKSDIKVNITENRLEVSAERKAEKKEEKEGYIYQERYGGRFYRSIPLPCRVDASKTKASYNNGILEVKMPKLEETGKTTIKVE